MLDQMVSLTMDDFQDSEMLCGYAREANKSGNADMAVWFKSRAKERMKQFWADMDKMKQVSNADDVCKAFMSAQKDRVTRMEYEIDHMK